MTDSRQAAIGHCRGTYSLLNLESNGLDGVYQLPPATRKLPDEGFKGPWPLLIKRDESVRKQIDALFNK